jgi:hypothetical protein
LPSESEFYRLEKAEHKINKKMIREHLFCFFWTTTAFSAAGPRQCLIEYRTLKLA